MVGLVEIMVIDENYLCIRLELGLGFIEKDIVIYYIFVCCVVNNED